MPKVSAQQATADALETDVEEMKVAKSVSQTVKAAAGATNYKQKSITSMFAKAASTPSMKAASTTTRSTTSNARRKVLEAQIAEALESQKNEEKAAPAVAVASSSTSQIAVPISLTLDTLEKDTMDPSWYEALKGEFNKPYFKELKKFLTSEMASHKVFPTIENIYSWSRFTPLDKVKVVVIGQDPYHDVGQAHGLSFSVLPPSNPPPSLRNIYKQLEQDYPGFVAPKKTGDLSPVASQGVLWLNSSLTVRAHQAGSHAKRGWETFTAQVLQAVLQRKGDIQGVVFLAWGLPAQKTIGALRVDSKKHLLLKSPHPSPLSAHRGFLGNKHFKLTNEWLEKQYGEDAGIDWMVLSAPKS